MNPPANPNDERFDQVDSVLQQLSNSQRHLLHAQVLMNDRFTKTETLVERLAEQVLSMVGVVQTLAGSVQTTSGNIQKLAEQVQIIADGQKHSDARIDALADMVRHLIEGNGRHLQ